MLVTQNIIDQICDADVVSFDIFDTLILRPFVYPRQLWQYIEIHYNCKNFYQYRAMCDGGEYATIDEQYKNMPEDFQHIKALEEQLEVELSIANEYVRKIYDIAVKNRKTIVIASDMYLPLDIIQAMLKKHNINYDTLYLSNNVKAEKSNGTMFQLIKANYPNSKILHIGDNIHSDIQMANKCGIKTIHVENICQKFLNENKFALAFLQKNNTLENNILIALVAITNHNYKYTNNVPIVSYWNKLGGIFGSIISTIYIQFIQQYVKQHNIQNIFFIARDGYIFKNIFDSIQSDDIAQNKIKTSYIYSPRMAVNNEVQTSQQQNEFKSYAQSLNITDNSVVVDFTSHNFSAKAALANALNRDVNEIVFMSDNTKYLQHTAITIEKNISWIFMFIECLFRAPTFPIVSMTNTNPVYMEDFNIYELFYIETANQMLNIQQYCVPIICKILNTLNTKLNNANFIDLLFLYMANLTTFEKQYLKTLRHLTDNKFLLLFPSQILT